MITDNHFVKVNVAV